MGENADQRRKVFRTLRKMMSMETLPKSKEEEGGVVVRDEVEGISVKAAERRRMSLNPEGLRGMDEGRVKLLRNKSFHSQTEDVRAEIRSDGMQRNGDVIQKRKMGEPPSTFGRALKCSPPPPLPLRSPTAQHPPMSPPSLAVTEGQATVPDKGLEELLECAVCLERLNDPRTLPCDHTFCLACLKDQRTSALGVTDGHSGVIRCPVCRKEACIPTDGGLAALPTNVYLISLLRLLSARRSSNRAKPTSPDVRFQTMLPPTNQCLKCGAIGQLHLYICGHCRQVLCSQCLPVHFAELKERMGHIREQIQVASQRLQDEEKAFTERFEQLKTQIMDETEKRLSQVREESTRLLERVNALVSKRLENSREIVGRLGNAVENETMEAFDASNTEGKVELFMKTQDDASELFNQASRWNQVLRSPLTFDRLAFRVLDPEDEEDEEEAEVKEEEEEEEEEDDEEDAEEEGEATAAAMKTKSARKEIKKETRRGERKATWEGEGGGEGPRRKSLTRAQPATHDDLSLYYRCRSLSAPRWMCGGSRGGAGAGDLYRPAGMCIAPWKGGTEIYVTLSDGGKVSVFTKKSGGWRYSRVLPSPPAKEKIMCPFGVAFSEKMGEVYVTDKWCHCIHVYDSEGNWIRRLCKQGRSPGNLSSPEGVAASNGYIFVADTGNDRVQVLNATDGGFVTFVGFELASYRREVEYADPSPGSGVLMQPTGVALTADETQLVVCDSGHNRIKIFDIGGLHSGDGNISNRPSCVFGSLGSQKGQLRSARGVAVDRLGFITVADSGNARIQIFRPDGRLVRAFGSKGKDPGQFGYPTAVHVGPSFELFVSDATNHCVYVY